jgi:hypothetical protein
MANYIFLKSLRNLEEFRKNPHVKIPPKSPCAKFQSLGKFKNPIFIRKEFFLRIQPTWLSRPGPAGQPKSSNPSPAQTAQPTWSLSRSARACLWRILRKTFSSSVHAFLSWPLSPSVTTMQDPPISFVISPTPADPGRNFPRAAAPRLGCPRAFITLPHHYPLLIPFKPSVNGP